jgi:hypothetical protein
MTALRIALVLSIAMTITIGLPSIVLAAPACNVSAKAPSSARTFARPNARSIWREYTSLQDVPDLELNNGISARFWQDRSKNRSVMIVEPGQDYWSYTRYCFDSKGELTGVGYEVRTELGWGVRAEGSMFGDGFTPTTLAFFSLKNGRAITKPKGVSDAPAALQPTVYRNVSDLPFAQLLKASTRKKHHGK